MSHYDKRKYKRIRRWMEHEKTWRLKYRLASYKYFNTIHGEMDTVYWVQARLWWLPIWLTVDEWSSFGTAYKELKMLEGIPHSTMHVYTEDECILELMGELDDD